MIIHRYKFIFIIAILICSSYVSPLVQVSAVVPTATFGYTIQKLTGSSYWKQITAGQTYLDNQDDGFTGAIALPFTFKYFEHSPSAFFICANGFIALDPAFNDCEYANEHIPLDVQPNDMIAAFWDDLVIRDPNDGSTIDGQVLVQHFTAEAIPYTVIEWRDATYLGTQDLLTFQIVLYSNGNIDLNYKTVQGDATQSTVGIEDRDGVDGIEALYKGVGFAGAIVPDLTLRFTYPTTSEHRVKAMPLFQSGLVSVKTDTRYVDFSIEVVNTGTVADTYTISRQLNAGENWALMFLNTDRTTFISNTGVIQAGDSGQIIARLTAPAGTLNVGQYSKQYIIFTSTDTTKSSRVLVLGAIPSSFVQMFSDYEQKINLDVVTQSDHFAKLASNSYDHAKSLAVSQIYPNDFWYLTAWRQENNIKFIRAHATSDIPPVVSSLTNNVSLSPVIRDTDPAVDVTQYSKSIAGITFIRDEESTTDGKHRYNVLFSRIGDGGSLLTPTPLNLTQNNLWWDGITSGVPYYYEPHITSIENRYVLSWVTNFVDEETTNSYAQITIAAYDENGAQVTAPYSVVESSAAIAYFSPQIARFDDSKIFLTYFSHEPEAVGDKYKLWLKILDGNGRNPSAAKLIDATHGDSLDMVKIGDKMFMAWSNNLTDRISHVFINSDGTLSTAIQDLESPDGRRMDTVSVTYAYPPNNTNPGAILTWENPQADRLYYAMINPAGYVTPPMIFREAQGFGEMRVVRSGAAGASIAPLPFPLMWYLELPFIQK